MLVLWMIGLSGRRSGVLAVMSVPLVMVLVR